MRIYPPDMDKKKIYVSRKRLQGVLMTEEQKQNFREFIEWFIAQPDKGFNQTRYCVCNTPACVIGHMNYYTRHRFMKSVLMEFNFPPRVLPVSVRTESLGISPSVCDKILTDTRPSLGNVTGATYTKKDAIFMLKHLLATEGQEIKWFPSVREKVMRSFGYK